MPVFRSFNAPNVVAVYDEPNQIGLLKDFDAPRNAPAKSPGEHVTAVYWHSEFFQYELAMPIQTVSVNHPSISGRSVSFGVPNCILNVHGNVEASNHTLITHGLGYAPLAFVVYNGRMVMPGTIVQTASQGRLRMIAPYATNNIIGLREKRIATDNSLGSVTRSYQLMIFRVPAIEAHRALFGSEGTRHVIGRGKIDTGRAYLRRVGAGDTPFIISLGPTIDINNGRTRTVIGGETTTDEGYGGSFSGTSYLTVGI